MAKITLDTITSGFGSVTKFISNFTNITNEFNNKVLYRVNPSGEANQMENEIDMNDNYIINVKDAVNAGDAVNLRTAGALLTSGGNGTVMSYNYTKAQLVANGNYSSNTFDLSSAPYNVTSFVGVSVFINGVLQQPISAYNATGTNIILSEDIEEEDLVSVFIGQLLPEPTINTTLSKSVGNFTAGGGETLVDIQTLAGITYTAGNNELFVFVDGVYKHIGIDYTETSTTEITFLSALSVGEVVTIKRIV